VPRTCRFAAVFPVSLALLLASSPPVSAAPVAEDSAESTTPEAAMGAQAATVPVEPEAESAEAEAEPAASVPAQVAPEPAASPVSTPSPTDTDLPSTADSSASHPRDVAEPREPTDFGATPLSTITPTRGLDADRALRLDKARGWRNAGIAGLAVGTVLIIGGALMLRSDPSTPELGNSNFADARDRAGYTILAPGLLISAGGVAMLTTGLVQERRLMMGPTASRDGAGLSVRGRF
jgi:hypothetical protein